MKQKNDIKKIKIQKKNEIKNKDLAKIQVIFIKRL